MNIVKQLQQLHNEQTENAKNAYDASSNVEKYDWFWHASPGVTTVDKLEAYISKHMMLWMFGTVTAGLGIGWVFGSFAGSMIGAWIGTVVGVVGGAIHAKHKCPEELKLK